MALATSTIRGTDGQLHEVLLDTITGQAYEIPAMKLAVGAEGSNDGFVSSANPMPVSVLGSALPSGASTAANQAELIANLGDVTDAKVQADSNGSLSAYLRGVVSWLADLIETRVQTPTKTKAINVQIGPGDVISNIPVVALYEHHQVHEGESFIFSDLQTAGLNAAATRDVRISVGALAATTRTPHLLIEFIADALAEIELYEGTTWISPGTAQVGYNRNRNVADDSGTLYVNGATALSVSAIGTAIWKGMTTGTKNSAGGTDRGAYEFVLKASTEYCVRVTSRTNGLKFLTRIEYYKDLGV